MKSQCGVAEFSGISRFASWEDTLLVERSLEGDLAAFDEVVHRHQVMITRCLYRFCPHQSDLEDLVQDTFIKAFRKLNLWKPEAPFENWLRKIAYNTGYDYIRKTKRESERARKLLDEEKGLVADERRGQRSAVAMFEKSDLAQMILSLLKPEDRLVLTLQYLESMSLDEICQQMSWSLSKTKVKSFRARKRLNKLLEEYGISHEAQ
ncbi:RNA polymerase sigma factor [Puniceicoccaceae bacterium K14]|nr:RNA polymerase sigma factor [Puniceicoccaceae bacterium K14]